MGKQAEKVNDSADNLQEDPSSKNLEKVKKDVEKMKECLKILSKMETHPELKNEIDSKITELNDALEALKRDMIPPVDPDKLARAIENLKKKTKAANEMVSQSLMMKQVADATKRAAEKAKKQLNKDTETITGDLDMKKSNAEFKIEVDKAEEKVEEYEKDPTKPNHSQ